MNSKNQELLKFYFKYIGDAYFIDALGKFSVGEGFGLEFVWCVFADYYEEWEEDYFGDEGVAFYFEPPAVKGEETIILDNKSFYDVLYDETVKYMKRNDGLEDQINSYLGLIKKILKISD